LLSYVKVLRHVDGGTYNEVIGPQLKFWKFVKVPVRAVVVAAAAIFQGDNQ
jgi:hypothetical protein